MKSSTKSSPASISPLTAGAILEDWSRVVRHLPADYEQSARQTGAFQRPRHIRSAGDLLRLVLMFAVSDSSLRLLGAWAWLQEVGDLSDVAVLNRLRHSGPWLAHLIGQALQQRCRILRELPHVRLRLMDATMISRPGSHGTDWRLHLGLNLWPLGIDGVEVTDAQSGESLTRLSPQPEEIRVADRGYAFVQSLAPLLQAGIRLVVRIHWQNLVLETAFHQRLDLVAWLKTLSRATALPVWLPTLRGRFALRLIASPLPGAAAERARRRLRYYSRKKGHTPSPEGLYAAGFVLLVTNLSAADWPLQQVLWLYRLRWQIEVAIKRFKSLLYLDRLRAQDPQLAQAYLLGKLLLILLVEQVLGQVGQQVPDWFTSLQRPVSVWRLTQLIWKILGQAITGTLSLQRCLQGCAHLQRYCCDSPRARPQQLAWARLFLEFKAGLVVA